MNRWSKLIVGAVLLAVNFVMVVPGWGREATAAGSAAERLAGTPEDASATLGEGLFRVEWSTGAASRGQARIIGYIYNDHGEDAVNVQLRISALDESGGTVASLIRPVGETVRAGGRAFFDLRLPGESPAYRVVVASFDFMPDGQWQTATTEHILAAAGFRKKIADTPEKLAHLETLTPARRLVAHPRDGQLYYVYADPVVCKCLYVGTAAQYQLALEKRLKDDQLVAVEEHRNDDAVIWGIWAPWPWF
jgi:hypothetical protein